MISSRIEKLTFGSNSNYYKGFFLCVLKFLNVEKRLLVCLNDLFKLLVLIRKRLLTIRFTGLWKTYSFMTPSSGKLCEDASQDCALLSFSNYTEKTFEIRFFSSLFYRGRKKLLHTFSQNFHPNVRISVFLYR